MAVPVKDAGGALQFGAAQPLANRVTVLGIPFYSVSPDSKKLLLEQLSQQVSQSVTVVTNFTDGLKK